MKNCIFKKASDLYTEIGEFILARKAIDSHLKMKAEQFRGIRGEEKVIIQAGGQYTKVSGKGNVVGNIDEPTRDFLIEKEEIVYLRESQKADLELVKMRFSGKSTKETGLEDKTSYFPDDVGAKLSETFDTIRARNPDLTPDEIMERIRGLLR